MKIDRFEIYRLDQYNWTYRVRKEKSNRGRKSSNGISDFIWKESKKYFGTFKAVLKWVRERIIDMELETAGDPNEAIELLDNIESRIKELIIVK